MLDELIRFYKNNLGTYKLVFRHLGWKTLSLIILMIIIILGSTLLSRYLTCIIFILGIFLCFWLINRRCKEIVLKEYEIKSEGFFWHDSNYHRDIVLIRLEEHLESERLIPELSQIITEIERRAEDLKTPSYINKGIWGAILIPIWIETTKWGFNYAGKNLLFAFYAFFILVAGALAIISISYSGSMVWEDLTQSEYKRLNALRDDLIEIKIFHPLKDRIKISKN